MQPRKTRYRDPFPGGYWDKILPYHRSKFKKIINTMRLKKTHSEGQEYITLSGQPNTLNGNKPDENHVSKTSGSCSSFTFSIGKQYFFVAFNIASSKERPLTQNSSCSYADVENKYVNLIGFVEVITTKSFAYKFRFQRWLIGEYSVSWNSMTPP